MKDEKELFKSMLVSTGKNVPWDEKQQDKEYKFYLLLVQVLLFAGAEAVKVVFRKNFQRHSINILAFIVACLCFAGISAVSFWQMAENDTDVDYFRGAIYGVITIIVVWQGVSRMIRANDTNQHYEGESELLSFLAKDPASSSLQYLYEPLVLITLGTFYCFFDIWGGLPLIACGVSVWVRWVVSSMLLGNSVQRSINEKTNEQYAPSIKSRLTAK